MPQIIVASLPRMDFTIPYVLVHWRNSFLPGHWKIGIWSPFFYLSGSSWHFSSLHLPIPQNWKVRIWSLLFCKFLGLCGLCCVCVSSNCSPAPFPLHMVRMTCPDLTSRTFQLIWPEAAAWLAQVCLWLGLSGSVIVRSLGGYGNRDWVMSIDITRHHPTVISGFGNGCQGHQTMTWPTGEWEPWNREVGLAWCPGSLRTLSVSALIELRKPIIPRQIWTSSHPQLVWRFSITSKSVTFILNVSKEQGTGTEETLNKHFLIKEWMD